MPLPNPNLRESHLGPLEEWALHCPDDAPPTRLLYQARLSQAEWHLDREVQRLEATRRSQPGLRTTIERQERRVERLEEVVSELHAESFPALVEGDEHFGFPTATCRYCQYPLGTKQARWRVCAVCSSPNRNPEGDTRP